MQCVSLAASQVINITASHNPPEYNGYKVYWEDGAQFTPPHDKGVTEEVLAIDGSVYREDYEPQRMPWQQAYMRSSDKEIDDKYIAHVKAQVVNQDAIDKMQKDITHRLHPASWYRKYPGKTCA